MVLLPSEKARLVLGYLCEQECYQAYKEFLISSPHLRELRGMIRRGIQPHEYDWKKNGLSNILDEYSSIECLVCALHLNCGNLREMKECSSLLKKVQLLIEFVSDFEDGCSGTDRSRDSTKAQYNTSRGTSKSPQRIFFKKKSKSVSAITKHDPITLQNNVPIIHDIPESHYSDDSTDIISISELSPFKANGVIPKSNDEKQLHVPSTSSADPVRKPESSGDLHKDIPEEKKDFMKKNDRITYSNLESIMDGLDISLYSEVLLERTDMHEKIAENINKLYTSEYNKTIDDKNVNTSEKIQSNSTQDNSRSSPVSTELLAHLDHVVKNIVNATENEEIFHEILDDIVTIKAVQEGPMSASSSDDTSPLRPTTSTPEHASARCDGRIQNSSLNTSMSPVGNQQMSSSNKTKSDIEVNKNQAIQEDSIKHRLRNRTKTLIEQSSDKIIETIPEATERDKRTPQKSNLDLLAMAICNADVSGSLRKLNTINSNNNSNDNKIVILSNEVVHRNLADYTCLPAMNFISENKNENAGHIAENVQNTVSLNTHFTLPNIANGNVFLNAPLPQYLISNTDVDPNRMYLIGGAPISLPSQSNVINNETSETVTMPTFIMLPTNAPSVPQVSNENTGPNIQTSRKPKAVILPQREIKKSRRKIAPNIKNYSDLLIISEQNKETGSTLTVPASDSENVPENRNNEKTNNQESKSLPTLETSVPELKKESRTETGFRRNFNATDSADKNLDKMQVSSTKTIEKMERETPELSTVQIQKRQSLSTPRRTKSHVRVLDFNTPPKMSCTRKAITSPKLGTMRASPKTAEKAKSLKKDPIKSVLFRSPKRKIFYFNDEKDSKSSSAKAKGESGKENSSNQENSVKSVGKKKLDNSNAKTMPKKMTPIQEENDTKNISHNSISSKQSKIIRVHPKRGEKFDFKPTLTKNKRNVNNGKLKSGWDSDLRALVSPLKCPVKRRNNKRKKDTETEVNKSDLSNTSGENMEMHAKQIEDALNFNLSKNTSNECVTDIKNSVELTKSADKNITEVKLIQSSNLTEPKEEESKKILQSTVTEKGVSKTFHKKCNNTTLLADVKIACPKNVSSKLPTINNEGVVCGNENSKDTASLNVIDTNDDTRTNKSLVKENVPVEQKLASKVSGNCDKTKEANIQSCNKTVGTKPSISDIKINISEQNFSLLETPFKCDGSVVPKTPRFICGNIVEDTPLVKINRDTESNSLAKCGIPTPNFPLTPKLLSASTPEVKTAEGEECASNVKKPSDNSGSSSYYKPDESENVNIIKTDNAVKNDLETAEKSAVNSNKVTDKKEIFQNADIDKSMNDTSNLSCNTSSSSDSSSDSSNSSSSDSSSSSDDTLTPEKTKLQAEVVNQDNLGSNKMNTESTISKKTVGPTTFKNCLKQEEKPLNKSTLASELNEKRQRILNKVRADLKLTVNKSLSKSNSIFNKKKSPKITIKLSENTNSKLLKQNLTTTEKDEALAQKNRKNCRKSESPRKRVNLENIETIKTLSKSEGSICENTMTIMHSTISKTDDYPLLHISDDESDQSFNISLDTEKAFPKSDNCAEKSPAVIVMNNKESSLTKKSSDGGLSNETNNETLEEPINASPKVNESSKLLANVLSEEISKQNIDSLLKQTSKAISNQKSNTSQNKSAKEGERSLMETTSTSPKQCNENNEELSTQLSTTTNEQQLFRDSLKASSDSIVELFNQPSDESMKSVKNNCNTDTTNTSLDAKLASPDQHVAEEQLSDEDLLEFTIHEQNDVELCLENENIRIQNTEEKANDGFDIDTFQINISATGVLKISPLMELLNMPPMPQTEEKSSKTKNSTNKMKVRKSPLNILYDELDEPIPKSKPIENTQEDNSTRTPCANLYHESPPSKYQKTKKSSKPQERVDIAKKSNKSKKSQKSDHHRNKTDPQQKVDESDRSNAGKSQHSSTNSAKDEKLRKRKREGENESIFSKKLKPCNPQELLKNVGLDTLLNALHGPE